MPVMLTVTVCESAVVFICFVGNMLQCFAFDNIFPSRELYHMSSPTAYLALCSSSTRKRSVCRQNRFQALALFPAKRTRACSTLSSSDRTRARTPADTSNWSFFSPRITPWPRQRYGSSREFTIQILTALEEYASTSSRTNGAQRSKFELCFCRYRPSSRHQTRTTPSTTRQPTCGKHRNRPQSAPRPSGPDFMPPHRCRPRCTSENGLFKAGFLSPL
jgi:hypothetical protein